MGSTPQLLHTSGRGLFRDLWQEPERMLAGSYSPPKSLAEAWPDQAVHAARAPVQLQLH